MRWPLRRSPHGPDAPAALIPRRPVPAALVVRHLRKAIGAPGVAAGAAGLALGVALGLVLALALLAVARKD